MTSEPLSDAEIRIMHDQNRKDLKSLAERVEGVEVIFFGVKEDPDDNGLKGDIKSLRNGQKWITRVGIGLILAFFATRYPDLVTLILKMVKM